MNTFRTDRFRILVFIKKRAEITTEEFDRYWLDEHSKVSLKFMTGKEAVLKYEQLHVNQTEKARLKTIGVPVLDYDGIVMFDTDSFEKFGALLNDEEYIKHVIPDEEKFVIREESIVVRTNIASIIDHDGDHSLAPQMGSAGSTDLKPPTILKKNPPRMIFTFNAKEGVDLSQAWVKDHGAVVRITPLGQSIIKYEQLHLAGPFVGLADNHNLKLPRWDGVALIDVPSFTLFQDPVSEQILAEDRAKWLIPGTMTMLPVDVATIIDTDVGR